MSSKFRIMVVDDDADVRYVVMTLLGLDFETVQATNGLDALEKIDRYQPDLLLMDVSMPIMNGIACCHAIQRNPSFENLPVLFLSASSDPETRRQAELAGGINFVEKPFDSSKLISLIQDFMATGNRAPQAKRFSVDDIKRIDATPLAAAGDPADVATIHDESNVATAAVEDDRPTEAKATGKRRVFGKKAAEPAAPPAPPAAEPPAPTAPAKPKDDTVDLPAPPKPDYSRASRELHKPLIYTKKGDTQPPPGVAPAPPPPPTRQQQPPAKPQMYPAAPSTPPPAALPPAALAPPKEAIPRPDLREFEKTREVEKPSLKPPAAPPTPAPAPPPPQASVPPAPSPADILAQRRMAALGKVARGPAAKPRVLVIIDHPNQLETCHQALKAMAEFLPLEDPVEAVELIARFQPDVVMMGIREQRYTGLQVASMIQSNPRLSHIEIVFVQGPFVESGHLAAARRITANPLVRPPFQVEEVRRAVQEVCNKPNFRVREKNVGYGVYVTEVLKRAESYRAMENKKLEKESYRENAQTLASFMARELKDYKEPVGYEELKGVGNKIHRVN